MPTVLRDNRRRNNIENDLFRTMVPPRFGVAVLLLVSRCSIATAGANFDAKNNSREEVECPDDCADLFKRLDVNDVQETKFQIRGGEEEGSAFSNASITLVCPNF